MGLERLHQASKKGFPKLNKAVKREQLFLKHVPMSASLHTDFKNHKQDKVASTYLRHYHWSDLAPLESTADGDCFFNSVSTLLNGNETRSIELRYRCCIEMVVNKSQIMIHPHYKRVNFLGDDNMDKECINCTKLGSFSSMVRFIAMSRLLNLPIQVVYPKFNGPMTYQCKVMNTLLRPPFADPDNGKLTLMYSHHHIHLPHWTALSSDQQQKRLKKFHTDKGKLHPNEVVSTNGQRKVIKTPSGGKKIGQVKRPRAERSRTPSGKRRLVVGEDQVTLSIQQC